MWPSCAIFLATPGDPSSDIEQNVAAAGPELQRSPGTRIISETPHRGPISLGQILEWERSMSKGRWTVALVA
jgi:hypothetical protein